MRHRNATFMEPVIEKKNVGHLKIACIKHVQPFSIASTHLHGKRSNYTNNLDKKKLQKYSVLCIQLQSRPMILMILDYKLYVIMCDSAPSVPLTQIKESHNSLQD